MNNQIHAMNELVNFLLKVGNRSYGENMVATRKNISQARKIIPQARKILRPW